MRYHIKAPGAFLWEPLVTDSLSSEVASGRIQGSWKIRRDTESTDYTVDDLCREEAGVTAKVSEMSSSLAQDSAAEQRPPRYGAMFCLAFFLVITCLWRVLATAHEYDSREMRWFSFGLDIFCLVALIAARAQIKRALPDGILPGGAQTVFLIGLLAGIVVLAIRFTSDASWATGHLHYDCCPPR